MIYLTGTHGQTWRSFADQLSAANPQSISAAVPSAKDLTSPGTEVIIFAECPASLIARSVEDPSTTLEGWKVSAAGLLPLWRRNRKRVAILNWDECLADPAAFDEWLSGQFGTGSGKAAGLLPATQSSLARRVIAEVIVAHDHEATRLWSELRAASQPIAKDFDRLTGASPALALRELVPQQEKALKTHEMLLQEIQNAHKESEDFFEQLEIARAEAEATRRELASVRAAHEADRQELERTTRALHQTEAAKQEAESRQRVVQDELSALHAESQSLKENALRNHEMLLQEIQNAHKESEDFFEQWKCLEASAQPHYLLAERTLRGGEKHHPPHSHLDYVFESASLFERHWRRLPVRLVEHHGNAGLAIFNPHGNSPNPLYHWKPDGQESGLDFMLFVPSDKNATDKLVGAPASDLLIIRDATAKILGHLSVHEGPEAKRWQPVAQRLLQEIQEIPERLHYDSVAGFVDHKDGKETIRFNATKPYFRGHCASALACHWTPGSSGGTLRLDPDTLLLLAGDKQINAGFASANDADALEKRWPHLTQHDRTFLLLLAKALPDFIFHLCEQHPDQKPHQERLTKQARKLYHRLRNLDRRQKVRSAIAKIIGR